MQHLEGHNPTIDAIAAAGRKKLGLNEQHKLLMVDLHCGCCKAPAWCIANIVLGIPQRGPRGGYRPATDVRKLHVTSHEAGLDHEFYF